MEGELGKFLTVGPCLVLFFLFAWRLGYYLRPKCPSCRRGRMKVAEQWFGNEKLKCDACGAEYWDLEL